MIKIYDDGTGINEVIIKGTLDDIDLLIKAAEYSIGGMSEMVDREIPKMVGIYENYLANECNIKY